MSLVCILNRRRKSLKLKLQAGRAISDRKRSRELFSRDRKRARRIKRRLRGKERGKTREQKPTFLPTMRLAVLSTIIEDESRRIASDVTRFLSIIATFRGNSERGTSYCFIKDTRRDLASSTRGKNFSKKPLRHTTNL